MLRKNNLNSGLIACCRLEQFSLSLHAQHHINELRYGLIRDYCTMTRGAVVLVQALMQPVLVNAFEAFTPRCFMTGCWLGNARRNTWAMVQEGRQHSTMRFEEV